jgi:hypothetical protein
MGSGVLWIIRVLFAQLKVYKKCQTLSFKGLNFSLKD